MPQSLQEQHLANYFPEDVLAQLDVAERNVLYDEFSNSELRILGTQTIEDIRAQTARHLQAEYERRLTRITAEEYPVLKSWYLANAKSVHEIICSRCKALLGIEVDTLDEGVNPNHIEGKFVVAVGDKMLSYRPRTDGIMGYQCGNVIKLTAADRKEIEDERQAKRKARRPELEKEITDRWANEFKETSEEAYQKTVEDEDFPEITSIAKAKKFHDFQAPGKEELATSVDINLDLEFPKVDYPENVACGNDTRWGQIEIDNIPEEHIMTSLTNDDIVKVKQEMNATNYEPDIQKTKTGYTMESFELREVKA